MYGADLTPIWRLVQIGLLALLGWGIYGVYKLVTIGRKPVIESNHIIKPVIKEITIKNGKADTTFVYNFRNN